MNEFVLPNTVSRVSMVAAAPATAADRTSRCRGSFVDNVFYCHEENSLFSFFPQCGIIVRKEDALQAIFGMVICWSEPCFCKILQSF